ncbi:MAG: SPOR domain-containing protein [Smithella sp.]
MMNSTFKKSNWTVLFTAGILFAVLATSPVFADYTGHVASFKSEQNAIIFVHKMKAKGIVAYYQKENVPGKGEFYRAYIGEYKTLPLAQKALAKLKKSGDIDYFQIQKTAEKSGETAANRLEITVQNNKPAQKLENKTGVSTQTNEPVQKPEDKIVAAAQNNEPVQKPEIKTEVSTQTNEPPQKTENKSETVVQTNEPVQKPENKIEAAAQKNVPAQKTEKKMELAEQKNEPKQQPVQKMAPSIDTRHYYDGIKGIVLKNGKVIKGQIISIDDNDVLKIRTKNGRILSYSFTKDVKEYIIKYEP